LSRALCDYIIYVDHNVKRALDLCALATQANDFQVRATRLEPRPGMGVFEFG
jgi:hypothetical protein